MDENWASTRLAALAKSNASVTARHAPGKAQQMFGGDGLVEEFRLSWLQCDAALFFTGEGTASPQKILISEDALGYKDANCHRGSSRFRNPIWDDSAAE